jgi:hypothetical protein
MYGRPKGHAQAAHAGSGGAIDSGRPRSPMKGRPLPPKADEFYIIIGLLIFKAVRIDKLNDTVLQNERIDPAAQQSSHALSINVTRKRSGFITNLRRKGKSCAVSRDSKKRSQALSPWQRSA